MSVESIKQVIKRWEIGDITVEQYLGKILLLLLQYEQRLTKLETETRRKRNG